MMAGRVGAFRCYVSRSSSSAFKYFTQSARHKSREIPLSTERCVPSQHGHGLRDAAHQRCFSSRLPDKFEASLQETAALDKLIDMMLESKSQEELGKIVTDNLLSYDQKFWIRVASRNDTASTPEDSQKLLESFLKAAADERGEWELPLPPEKLKAMQEEVEANFSQVDESLLATAGAWMRKAASDKMDGMVTLLQQVLQIYAAKALTLTVSPSKDPEDEVLDGILKAPESSWIPLLKREADAGRIRQNSFQSAVRKRMETIVLALPSGSNAQRIQAEYLKELEGRADNVFKTQASS